MGNECCSQKHNQILTQIQKYDCFHIERSLQKLSTESKSTRFISTYSFKHHLGLSSSIAVHVASCFNKDGNINWRQCLSGLLLCVRGSTAQKAPLFRDIFEFEDEIPREAFTEAVSITLHAVQRLCVPGSGALFPCVDNLATEVAASLYRHKVSPIPSTSIKPATLQQWSERHPLLAAPPPVTPPPPCHAPISSARWFHVGGEGGGQGAAAGPSARRKHAICVYGDVLYMHAGKAGNLACRDLWKCTLGSSKWERVWDKGERPPNLQGHSMLPYKNKLYVFGGNFGYSATDTPLWILDTVSSSWVKQRVASEVVTPSSRRHHTAVIYNGVMYVYGGYIDLKGSTSQLWMFDLDENQWHLQQWGVGDGVPDARHAHSATVHGGGMWVVAGMTDLKQRDDMWHWDFGHHEWTRVRCSGGHVPQLSGHSACVVGSSAMLIHGGATDGVPQNDTWIFNFGTTTWSKLSLSTLLTPTPRTDHCSILLSPLLVSSISPPPHNLNTTSASNQPRCSSLPALEHLKVSASQPRPSSSPAYSPQDDADANRMFQNRIGPVGNRGGFIGEVQEDGRERGDEGEVQEEGEGAQAAGMTRQERKERLYQKKKEREIKRQKHYKREEEKKLVVNMLQTESKDTEASRERKGNSTNQDSEMMEMKTFSKSDNAIHSKEWADMNIDETTTKKAPTNPSGDSAVNESETNSNNNHRQQQQHPRRHRRHHPAEASTKRARLLQHQSSSCESMHFNADAVPLLKNRSNTIGNISVDSGGGGFSNPTFAETASMYSRNSSREDHANADSPAKRQRSDTEFSDDFMVYLPKRSDQRPLIGDHVSAGSIDSLMDSFGGVTFTQKVVTREKFRYPHIKSRSTNDLIVEDIEDVDMSIVGNPSEVNNGFLDDSFKKVSDPETVKQSNPANNDTIVVNNNISMKKASKAKVISTRRCEWMMGDHMIDDDDELDPNNQSFSSQSELVSRNDQSEAASHSNSNQSEKRLQMSHPPRSSEKIMRNSAGSTGMKHKQSSSMTYQNGAFDKRLMPSSSNTPLPKQSPTPQQYHLYIFGGKELEGSNIGQLPLPIWKLELTMQVRK